MWGRTERRARTGGPRETPDRRPWSNSSRLQGLETQRREKDVFLFQYLLLLQESLNWTHPSSRSR